MLERQKQFAQPDGHFIFLSADASPQGSLEYFIVLEDRIKRSDAALIIEGTESEIEEWRARQPITTSVLPVCILGSGHATTAAKFDCLTHAAALDCMHEGDLSHLAAYSSSVLGFCSDWGSEGHLCQDRPYSHSTVQPIMQSPPSFVEGVFFSLGQGQAGQVRSSHGVQSRHRSGQESGVASLLVVVFVFFLFFVAWVFVVLVLFFGGDEVLLFFCFVFVSCRLSLVTWGPGPGESLGSR